MEPKDYAVLKTISEKLTLKHFGKWREETVETGSTKLTPKQKAIRKAIITGEFECRTRAILKLMSLVLDTDLGTVAKDVKAFPAKVKRYNIPPALSVFVLDDNPNQHDYSLHVPYIRIQNNYALGSGGYKGNHVPNDGDSEDRCFCAPTKAEFDEFFKTLQAEQVENAYITTMITGCKQLIELL